MHKVNQGECGAASRPETTLIL